MSIDLSQFHQVFFEESFEGLDVMEQALMDLDPSALDDETINAIFRAAHSIKGGSATFGFMVVSEFTHVLETLLDQVRSGERGMSTEDVDLYLQSVDVLRELLGALQADQEPDMQRADALKQVFEGLLTAPAAAEASEVTISAGEPVEAGGESAPSAEPSLREWHIQFSPSPDILQTGNEPLRMFRELAEFGPLEVTALPQELPAFTSLEPESCYLAWQLRLRADVERAVIEEVFEWVAEESTLEITALDKPSAVSEANAEPPVIDTSAAAVDAVPDSPVESPAAGDMAGWRIRFRPGRDIMRTGNDPLRMFRELESLGQLRILQVENDFPEFAAFDAEASYLTWELELKGELERAAIDEVFEWVVDESELTIEPLTAPVQAANGAASQETLQEAPQETPSAAIATAHPALGAAATQANPEVPGAVNTAAESSVAAELSAPASPQPSAPTAAAKRPAKVAAPSSAAETTSIRVGIDKVDNLINMVGELVITQSMLGQLGGDFQMEQLPKLLEGLSQLEQNTRELQESVMRIRMLPISFVFSRFPRMVRDLGRQLNKDIQLQLFGEQTELDKTVMEKIGDPLVHLVRNAVDHGIETVAEREASGKTAAGCITLNAYHQGGNVVIEIIDDGRGLNRDKLLSKAIANGLVREEDAGKLSDAQVYDLIFHPGFSTAEQVTDVSGRGVGMDVVRRNIQDLNGSIELASEPGKGSSITIRLPLTLAILDGQLVRVGVQTYVFSLVSIIESIQVDEGKVSQVAGGCEVFELRDEFVPLIWLCDVLNVEPDYRDIEDALVVVVECDGERVGIVIDELQAQQQVVIKSLEENYHRVEGVSGATILGDGTVALIMDIPGLVSIAGIRHQLVQRKLAMQDESQRLSAQL